MKNLKSLISMLLCVVLLLGVMGAGALAAAEDPAEIIDAAVNENQLTAEAVTEEAAANAVESAESEEVQAAPETGKKEAAPFAQKLKAAGISPGNRYVGASLKLKRFLALNAPGILVWNTRRKKNTPENEEKRFT